MTLKAALLTASLAALGRAAQPDASKPVPAPMRNLTWGQLNFLHTTDTHGWLTGHMQEPQYSSDWGDYVSFAARMREQADARGVDLILVDTGDRVEGNGLYDASRPKGVFSSDIFREAPIDIICSGNHELYRERTARREHEIVAGRDFADRYLASNLDYVEPESGRRVPQAKQRFRRFTTPNQGLEVLAFGFLFDFQMNAPNTVVQPVEEAVREPWFEEEIRKKPDVIVVAGHVGLRMDEFRTIYAAIRKLDWSTPVLFFGGHAHVRDAVRYDSMSFAMASGRYFETVGWMSADGIKKSRPGQAGTRSFGDEAGDVSAASSLTFSRRYIDNNLYGYRYHTGLDESTFPTRQGRLVSKMINGARTAMDLDHKFGCIPETMWMNRAPYPSKDSIYTWLTDRVVPDMVVNATRAAVPRLVILNTGGIRFDIFKGSFTRDAAYIVSPFDGHFEYLPDVPYDVADKVLGLLNSQEKIFSAHGASNAELGLPQNRHPIPMGAVSPQPDSPEPRARLELRGELPLPADKRGPALTAGYTTHDDVGDDGDDTVHSEVEYFSVPNCVQAEVAFPASAAKPETVDLVFADFIQPWILPAVKLAGGDFSEDDIGTYTDESLTYMVTKWIQRNWGGEC